ncbi:hypothetical protein ACA910_002696 [Epithemia clementina (nom. ined.)]
MGSLHSKPPAISLSSDRVERSSPALFARGRPPFDDEDGRVDDDHSDDNDSTSKSSSTETLDSSSHDDTTIHAIAATTTAAATASNDAADISQQVRQATDYYAILGVRKDASLVDIKRNYRSYMRLFHPDNNNTGDTWLSAKINQAYAILSDPEARCIYDKDQGSTVVTMYAKHTVAEIYKEMTSPFASHDVEWEELLEGDHVYYLMRGMCGAAHHGIVVRVGKHRQDVRIIDFGVAHAPTCGNHDGKTFQRVIREATLDSFLPFLDTTLKRAEYGQSAANAYWKLVGAYQDIASPPQTVLVRARRLFMLGHMEYDTMAQSCETVAFWCKTGKRYSGQADKFQRLLNTVYLYCRGADFARWIVVFLCANATGVALTTTEAGSAAAAAATTTTALSSTLAVPLAVISSLCFVGVIAFSLRNFVGRRRCLQRAQPFEAINLITKLQSRDRSDMASMRDPVFDHNEAVIGLARKLDDYVLQNRVNSLELPTHVSLEFQLHFHRYGGFNASHGRGGDADTMLDYSVQVLLRCETFNAILDLPDPELFSCDQWKRTGYIVTTLMAAESYILDGRALRIENLQVASFVSCHRDADTETFADDYPKPLFQFSATARLGFAASREGGRQQQGAQEEEVVELNSYKIGADFQILHQVLIELHPEVQKLKAPSILEEDSRKFATYLKSLIRLSELRSSHESDENHTKTNNNTCVKSLDTYLKTLQATEVREQVVAFLSNSSTAALEARALG